MKLAQTITFTFIIKKYRSLLLLVCLLFLQSILAQNSSIDSSVLKEFEVGKKLLDKEDYESYSKGSAIITQLEKKLISKKNNDQLLYLYLEISYYYLTKYDYASSKKVLDKVEKLLSKHNNNLLRGSYYEHLAVLYNAQGNEALDEKYTLLSEKYLSKYAPKEKLVDLNFNLILLYLKKENWQKVLNYSFKFLELNKDTGGDLDQPEINLFIVESYYNLNDINKAFEYLDKVKTSNFFQNHDEDFLLRSRYYLLLGKLKEKQGSFKEAAANLSIANDFFKKRLIYRVTKVNKSFEQKRALELKNIEYQYIIKQHELEKQNLKYKNYLLLLCLITIVALLFLVFNQIRNLKYKSKTNQLLNEKNVLLNRTNSELESALNIKKKLLDTISHELRTPIYTLNGLIHLMKVDKDNYESNIEQLEISAQNLYNLFNNIIEINVLDTVNEEYVPQRDSFSLKEMLLKIIDIIEKSRDNNNKVKVEYDNSIPEKVIFDQSKLYQVLYSLIDNAFKFTKNGNITIAVNTFANSETSLEIQFVIKDSGIGIASEIKDNIYESFFQGSDKINYEYGGSGLGLTLVQKTLALFNKTIQIESESNIGTKVSFNLNFELSSNVNNYDEIKKDNNIKPIQPEKIRILLVEDNKINQLITKKIIVQKKFNCDIANNGLEACKMVEQRDYDLILMDIMMPVMDGFEASEHIAIKKPKIPIVALTAISEEMNKEKFSNSTIKKVLTKPVDIDGLYNTIEMYCGN